MKKIFSFMLIAAGLLISGQVKAANNCTWSVDGVSQGAASLETVLTNISDVNGNVGGAYSNKLIEITLTDNVLFSGPQGSYQDFGFKNKQNVVIDLGNGNAITGHGFRFKVGNARLEFKGKGSLTHLSLKSRTASMFYVTGMDTDDPSYAANPASYLIIGKDVTVTSNGYCAGIMYSGYYGGTTSNNATARAYGSRIDVYGKIKSTGSPEAVITVLGTLNTPGGNVPVINLFDGSEVICDNDHLYTYAEIGTIGDLGGSTSQGYIRAAYPETYNDYKCAATAVYAAGYGKYNIKGLVSGGNGVYIKGGIISIDGAQIYATATEYWKPICYGSGAIACGSAIVLDNNAGYNSGQEGYLQLEIKGETYVEALSGSAIEEATTSGKTVLTGADIKIESGTFVGSEAQGCINIDDDLVAESVQQYQSITGGTYSDETVQDLINENTGVIVPVVKGTETVYVITSKPAEKEWKTDINSAIAGDYVSIATGTENITLNGDKTMEYLTISAARKVIVPTGKKLSAGEIVLGDEATIEVQPGGKLIINGVNGLVAFVPENLVLKADAENGMGTFVLNPAVKANKTPYATIEFMTNAASGKFDYPVELGAPTDYKWEMIASPFVKMDTIISEVPTYYERIENGAFVQRSKQVIIEETEPFEMIAMCPAAAPKDGGYKYTFVGQLQGANDLSNKSVENKFNYMGNAYTAKLDAQEMITELQEAGSAVRSVIYLWNVAEMKWDVYNSLQSEKLGKINPMAAFVLYSNAAGTMDLSYEKLIWDVNK